MANPILAGILVSVNKDDEYSQVVDADPAKVAEYTENDMVAQEAFQDVLNINYDLDVLHNASVNLTNHSNAFESKDVSVELKALAMRAMVSPVTGCDLQISQEGIVSGVGSVMKAIYNAVIEMFKRILRFLGFLRTKSQQELARSKTLLGKVNDRIKKEGNVRLVKKLTIDQLKAIYVHGGNSVGQHIASDVAKLKTLANNLVDEMISTIDKELSYVKTLNDVPKLRAINDSLKVSKHDLKDYVIGDAMFTTSVDLKSYTVEQQSDYKGGNSEFSTDLSTCKHTLEALIELQSFVAKYSVDLESKQKKYEDAFKTLMSKVSNETTDKELAGAVKDIVSSFRTIITNSFKIVNFTTHISGRITNVIQSVAHAQ